MFCSFGCCFSCFATCFGCFPHRFTETGHICDECSRRGTAARCGGGLEAWLFMRKSHFGRRLELLVVDMYWSHQVLRHCGGNDLPLKMRKFARVCLLFDTVTRDLENLSWWDNWKTLAWISYISHRMHRQSSILIHGDWYLWLLKWKL